MQQQMQKEAKGPVWFPRGALFGAAALVMFSLSVVAIERITGSGIEESAMPGLSETRTLRFLDQDGEVVVFDDRTELIVARFGSGTNGFARGLLRGLARDRRLREADRSAPFELGFNAENRLTLRDPETSTDIVLDAFGSTNRNVFSDLHESAGELEDMSVQIYAAADKETRN
jgi:putative photosynthetic complex assembly protein